MIKNIPNGSIFTFANSAYYFMRVERGGVPHAVRLMTAEVLSEAELKQWGYVNPKVEYSNLDELYFEEVSASSTL